MSDPVLIDFIDAVERLGREDRFKATVYAMNTLLVQKGIFIRRKNSNFTLGNGRKSNPPNC